MDGCEHYDTIPGIYLKWTNAAFASPTASGRNGRGISLNQGGAYVAKTLNHQVSWVVNWAMNILISGGGGTGPSGIYVGANVGTGLVGITVETDWTLSIYAGGNLAMNSSPFSIHPNSWYYYEFKYELGVGGSSGNNITVVGTLKVNGNIVVTCAGVDTGINLNTLLIQTATVDYHNFICPNIVGTSTIDDIIIADCSGNGLHNDFMGDIAIGVIFPNGDSSITWTPTPSGSSYSLVNSQFVEDSAGTISSNTPSQVDVFNWQPLPSTVGTIIALHYGIFAKKNGEGTRAIQPTVGGSSIPTLPFNESVAPYSAPFSGYPPPIYYPGDTYVYYFFAMDSQPGGTPVAWTVAVVNGTTFGVELYS